MNNLSHRITNKILKQKKYSYLISSNMNNNYQVKDINHLTDLKILYARGSCGIYNRGISKLNLIEVHHIIIK